MSKDKQTRPNAFDDWIDRVWKKHPVIVLVILATAVLTVTLYFGGLPR